MFKIKVDEVCAKCGKEILRDKLAEHAIIEDEFVDGVYCACEDVE